MWGSFEEMLRQASGKGVSCGEGEGGGRKGGSAAAGGDDDLGARSSVVRDKSSVVASSINKNTSAYMLVYRRRGDGGTCDMGTEGENLGAGSESQAHMGLPGECMEMVREENERLVKLQRLEGIQQQIVTVRAWGSKPPAEEGGGWGGVDEEQDVVVEVLQSTSLAALTLKVAAALGLQAGRVEGEEGSIGFEVARGGESGGRGCG